MINNVEEELKRIIFSCGENIVKADINENTDLVNDFGFTSINLVQLVVEIEEVFNIEIDDDYLSLEKLSPYKSLLEILYTKMKEVQ